MFLTRPLLDDPTAPLHQDRPGSQPSLAWSALLSNGIFIALVAIFISLRIFTKLTIAKKVYLDDYLMTASAVLFLVLCSVNLAAVHLGFGKHIEDLAGATRHAQITTLERILHHNFGSMLLINLSVCLAKLSIVATLLRVFDAKTLTTTRAVLLTTALVVVVTAVAQLFALLLQCSTVRLSWRVSLLGSEGSCSNLETALVVTGAINAVTSFVITCAPVPMFMRLQMPLRQRLCLSALFLSGLIACAFALIRVASAHGLSDPAVALDETYTSVAYFNWSNAEAALCIMTGSVPGLRPLLATILPQFFETHSMDDLFGSVKETVRNVASRQGSRSRAGSTSEWGPGGGGGGGQHARHSSEASVGSYLSRSHTYDELDSPTTTSADKTDFGARLHETPRRRRRARLPTVADALGTVLSLATGAVCALKKMCQGTTTSAAQRGRARLSVIDELDEVASRRGRDERNRQGRIHQVLRVDVAGAVADAKWRWGRARLNVWRPGKSQGPVRDTDPSRGVVIVMAEVPKQPTMPERALVMQGKRRSSYPV